MWSSPASSPEAILTRTAVSMMYFLFTSVAARYNFWLPSASFTTLAFSFVIGKIHCNWAKRAACPATLCNRSGLSANWNAFNFWVTRDTPVFPISCPSHVTKQQYGDCGNNRISHCSEKKEQRSPMKLNHVSQREANLRYLGWVGLALRVGVGWEWVRYNHLGKKLFNRRGNVDISRRFKWSNGKKRRENAVVDRVVQRSLFELDRLDEACQKSERYSFFRNTLNIIISFKAVSILENCGKRQKVYAKVRTSGAAEGYKPCSSQMSY